MSKEEPRSSSPTSSEQLNSDYADLRDGQLQIVEVTPFDRSDPDDESTETIHIQTEDGTKYMQVLDNGTKYMQVLESDGKGLMQLDLLNLTLVRCGDGEEYRLVTNVESQEDNEYITPETTVILQSSETDDGEDASESYVMVEREKEQEEQESYVMVEAASGPVVYLQSDLQPAHVQKKTVTEDKEKPVTTLEILERAKALHKAKTLLTASLAPQTGRGRRRKHEMPSPSEILESPNFKLFLYSCKQCSFKCNAISELTKHRTEQHAGTPLKYNRNNVSSTLQCARCPFRGASYQQLMRHVQDNHMKQPDDGNPGEILVCGACGFESHSRQVFRVHIQTEHAQSSTVPAI